MMTGRKWMAGCLCLVVFMSTVGCAPLRKKFTRQKKDNKEGKEIIPVLEPIDYPVKAYGLKEAYAQHYSLCRVWLSDFNTSRDLMAQNEKKLRFSLDASLKEIDEMDRLLSGADKEKLAKIKEQVQFLRDEYDKPLAFRNESRIRSELRAVDKAIRTIKPDMVSLAEQ